VTCPRCSRRIPLDLMRCIACGYDLLPQDIAHSPQTIVAPGRSARAAAELTLTDSAYPGLPTAAELAEMIRRGKRDAIWLLFVFLAVAVAIALLVSLGRWLFA